MTSTVAVIAGPARSGKTERLLGQYRQILASNITARCLWIAPTARAVREVRDRLLSPELPACFRPGVMTFDQVAEAILHVSPDEVQPISSATRRLILRHLIQAAQEEGRLRRFAPIAGSRGLLDLVVTFISELKRLEVWPHDFAAACAQGAMTEGGAMTDKDRELTDLYTAYQEVLNSRRLYDQQGRFWSARTRLQQGQGPPFEKIGLLVVDGFTDFTRPQHEILQVLASRSDVTRIALTLDTVAGREDLFDKPLRTLSALQDRHLGLAVEKVTRDASATLSAIGHVESELFKSPQQVQPYKSATSSVQVLSISRELGELEEVARQVKRLILEKNVAPGDIGVVFRSLTESAPLVREVFDQLGIPVAIEEHLTLSSAPVLRALAVLVRLAVEDWPFRQVLDVMNNGYVLSSDDRAAHDRAVAATERLVRHLQIPSGRSALLRQVGRWSETDRNVEDEAQAEQDWPAERHRLASRSYPLLQRLAELTDILPERGTCGQWADALAALAKATDVLSQSEDRAAWECLQDAIASGDQVSKWLGKPKDEISRDDFLALLLDLLQTVPLPRSSTDGDEIGRVRILTAPSVRGLRIPHLFVAGLTEKAFPSPERSDRPYSDAELRRLIDAGLPLVDRRQSARDEMLLFYEVVTRAGKSLTLSYPAHDDKAEPLSASPYVAEVERLFGSNETTTEQTIRRDLHNLSPIPQSPRPLSAAELRVCAVSRAMSGDRRLLAGLVHSASTAALWDPIAAGLQAVEQRFRGDRFGCYEGIIEGSVAQQAIALRFGPDTLWSPSRLDEYASCPYKFFLERVLQLAPLEDLSLEVDYRGRGQLLHSALATVHRRLNERSGSTVSPSDLDAEVFSEEIEAAISALMKATHVPGDVGATLRELDGRQVHEWLAQYHPRHVEYDRLSSTLDSPLRPAHFEVRFGPDRHATSEPEDSQSEDSQSTDQPFELEVDGERVLITGRIDRIDLGVAAGQQVFNIIDYKSGKSGKLGPKHIEGGEALQLPLYAMAAEQLLLAGEGAVPWKMGYWLMEGTGFAKHSLDANEIKDSTLVPTEAWQALRPRILDRVRSLIAGIRSASYPVENADETCTSRCSFNQVCRVAQARSVGKTWVPLSEDAP